MEACFLAGADPELMLVNPEGELVSAIGVVPGTKKRPYKVDLGAVQRDNVMAEFNIFPAENLADFKDNIRAVLNQLSGMVAPNRLVVRASANFPDKCLRNKEARRFGCDPDFDAWELMRNVIPAEASLSNFRSAGGHLHIGKKPGIEQMLDAPMGKVAVIRMLDIFVGIPSIIMDTDPSAGPRRALYGKAGAHRPKSYGVEYRALGNFWIRTPQLTEVVYRLADVAVKTALDIPKMESLINSLLPAVRVQQIINESKWAEAALVVDQVLRPIIGQDLAEEVLVGGLESMNLYEAWSL